MEWPFLITSKSCSVVEGWLLSSGLRVSAFLVGALIVKKAGDRLLGKALEGAFEVKARIRRRGGKRRETLRRVLSGLFGTLVWTFCLLAVLSELGVNVQALLAGMGVLGFALGIASKEALSDYIAGIFILFSGQYGVGDRIKIGGKEGRVVDLSLRRTVLKNEEGTLHFVPHRKVGVVTRKNSS